MGVTKDSELLLDILKSQLKRYPASSVMILGTDIDDGINEMIPKGKYKSTRIIDINKQAVYIPSLSQYDLLITNLLLEKMGYDFFINLLHRVKPQFVCCSFHVSNRLGITEDELASRLTDNSYDLFSRSEISLSSGKTLIQLDFIVSSQASSIAEPVKSSYKTAGKELMSLSVYNVGYQKCEPRYQLGPGIRDHYLILYIISGSGTYASGDKEYGLYAGDCFIVYPHREISYTADKHNPWEYAWVGFNGPDAGLILSSTDFTPDAPYIRKEPHGMQIEELIRSIYNAKGNGFTSTIQMTGRLYELLALFVNDAATETMHSVAQLYVKHAVEYIVENYSDPISIEDVASYIGVSRSQLFRCFQSVIGKSPKEYLTEYRIKQACHLLSDTSFSMNAIANSLGFDNSLYFSKAFHKAQGISPSEYRNGHKKDR